MIFFFHYKNLYLHRDQLVKRVFSSVFSVPGSLTGCYGGFALCDYYPRDGSRGAPGARALP